MSLTCSGVHVYFINDFLDNFYPVISVSLREISYKRTIQEEQEMSEAMLQVRVQYYNINAGLWEPFIEQLHLKLLVDKGRDAQFMQVKSEELINVDLSLELVQILHSAAKSWHGAFYETNEE